MKSICSRIYLFTNQLIVYSWLVGTGCSAAQNATDPLVGFPGDAIVFDRFCAGEGRYDVGAYAIMQSEDQQARALVRIRAGYFSPQNPQVAISIMLLEFELQGGAAWSSADMSLQLLASNGERELASQEQNRYVSYLPGGEPDLVVLATTASGQLQWRDFVEPWTEQTGDDASYHYFSDGFMINAGALVRDDPTASVRLSLRLRRINGSAEILLAGPSIHIPDRIWAMEPPQFRELGLFETINPLQEGGIFDWLGTGLKYRNCVDERREARIRFRN